ncbi:MAG: hypothetical protein L0Y44_07630 [Phycisphaerales bacterium]|nr:hypothetical protein [Phycisphaerales bacterium]
MKCGDLFRESHSFIEALEYSRRDRLGAQDRLIGDTRWRQRPAIEPSFRASTELGAVKPS